MVFLQVTKAGKVCELIDLGKIRGKTKMLLKRWGKRKSVTGLEIKIND